MTQKWITIKTSALNKSRTLIAFSFFWNFYKFTTKKLHVYFKESIMLNYVKKSKINFLYASINNDGL